MPGGFCLGVRYGTFGERVASIIALNWVVAILLHSFGQGERPFLLVIQGKSRVPTSVGWTALSPLPRREYELRGQPWSPYAGSARPCVC